jgi:hypothetical protein
MFAMPSPTKQRRNGMPHDELIERLLATRSIQHTVSARDDDDPVPRVPINPDGPEAAEALTTMQAREATLIRERDMLREALRPFTVNQVVTNAHFRAAKEALGTSGLVER